MIWKNFKLLFFIALLALGVLAAHTFRQPTPYSLKYNPDLFSEPNIQPDNPLTIEGIRLGRLLFYDTLLSGNGRQSCGSCHLQDYSFTDGKMLAVGSKGDTVERNTMSLVNLAWGNRFFWDGRVETLEALVRHPITDPLEMALDEKMLEQKLKKHAHYPALFQQAFPDEAINMNTVSKAISQFLRTIVSKGKVLPDSINPESYLKFLGDHINYSLALQEASFKGMYLRLGAMCTPCHTTESFGGELMANNLLEPNQTELFKVPSLMNVLQTAPYMHDGRFGNVDEILPHYEKVLHNLQAANPHLDLELVQNMITDFDKQHFRQFLELFTDSSILMRNDFSNPFAEQNFDWKKI